MTTLDWVTRENLSEEVTFKLKSGLQEEAIHIKRKHSRWKEQVQVSGGNR